jgi:hypothetical protein
MGKTTGKEIKNTVLRLLISDIMIKACPEKQKSFS